MNRIGHHVSDFAFAAAMTATGWLEWQPFQKALDRPCTTQESLMARILARNAETEFGRRYGFKRIRTLDAFQQAVPPASYESLQPLIAEQARTGRRMLTVEAPAFYNRTSGTTGAAKLVPVTPSGFRQLRRLQRIFAYAQWRDTETFDGRILAIAGSAIEDRTATGVPIGSASGAVYAAMPAVVRGRYVIPPEILTIGDYDMRDYLIALLGLASCDVSAFATANPSTIGRLLRLMKEDWDLLLEDLGRGTPYCVAALNPEQRACLRRQLGPEPARARELRRLCPAGPTGLEPIWPGLKSIVTWTGGCCGYALGALAAALPRNCRIIDLGYHASECRGSINIDPCQNACVPAITTTIFEFVERSARDRGVMRFLGPAEIEMGRDYYIYVTTVDGLYRYDMNDIVRVTGCIRATPTIAFVQKGRGVVNITGEKLSEEQVLMAVGEATRGMGISAPFFLLLGDEARLGYQLYIEEMDDAAATVLAATVDVALMRGNIEYAAKRKSGRLLAVSGTAIRRGTGEAFRRHCLEQGQRDTQFKPQHLQYRRDCSFDLSPHIQVEAKAA